MNIHFKGSIFFVYTRIIMDLVVSELCCPFHSLINCNSAHLCYNCFRYVRYVFTSVISRLINVRVLILADFIIYKTRLQKIWTCICPTHLFVHFVFVALAMINAVSLLKLTGLAIQDNESLLNVGFVLTILYCGYLVKLSFQFIQLPSCICIYFLI